VFVGAEEKVSTYQTIQFRIMSNGPLFLQLASIGIQIRHRITSHGFAINVTTEPIPWFDLVTACGLNDVRATSLQGTVTGRRRQEHSEHASRPVLAVDKVANDLMPFFGAKFNRRMVPLHQIAGSQESTTSDAARDIWWRVWDLIRRAETESQVRLASYELPRSPKREM